MNKQEVIQQLKGLKNECEIAEIICDINSRGDGLAKPCYPNESIIVMLVSQPSNDDLICNSRHWTICGSIEDFEEGIVYGMEEADESGTRYFVADFKSVKPFEKDTFLSSKRAQELADKFTTELLTEIYGDRFTKLENIEDDAVINSAWEEVNKSFYVDLVLINK